MLIRKENKLVAESLDTLCNDMSKDLIDDLKIAWKAGNRKAELLCSNHKGEIQGILKKYGDDMYGMSDLSFFDFRGGYDSLARDILLCADILTDKDIERRFMGLESRKLENNGYLDYADKLKGTTLVFSFDNAIGTISQSAGSRGNRGYSLGLKGNTTIQLAVKGSLVGSPSRSIEFTGSASLMPDEVKVLKFGISQSKKTDIRDVEYVCKARLWADVTDVLEWLNGGCTLTFNKKSLHYPARDLIDVTMNSSSRYEYFGMQMTVDHMNIDFKGTDIYKVFDQILSKNESHVSKQYGNYKRRYESEHSLCSREHENRARELEGLKNEDLFDALKIGDILSGSTYMYRTCTYWYIVVRKTAKRVYVQPIQRTYGTDFGSETEPILPPRPQGSAIQGRVSGDYIQIPSSPKFLRVWDGRCGWENSD